MKIKIHSTKKISKITKLFSYLILAMTFSFALGFFNLEKNTNDSLLKEMNHQNSESLNNENMLFKEVSDFAQTENLMLIILIGIIAFTTLLIMFVIVFLRLKRKMEKVAYYDDLTGLPNLEYYKRNLADYLKKYPESQFVTVKMDVDNFKAINEIYGFSIGDEVLKTFKTTGDSVEENTFLIARTGADEFMMFSGNNLLEDLENLTPHYEAFFKNAIPQLEKHNIAFNYGRYIVEEKEKDVNQIITKTSMAHSIAKAKRDGKVWDYDDNYKNQILSYAKITSKMNKALLKNEFKTYLQPKFDISSGRLIGAEALVRWIEEDGTMIYPDEFIPLFESNGFIIDVDKYMLDTVCKTIKQWKDNGYQLIPVSVNFSRHHISNEDFADEISLITKKYDIENKFIEIELTETGLLENEEQLEIFFLKLYKAGFKISIDDFGAGYSSLGLLKNVKTDIIKLDRSFLTNNKDVEKSKKVIEGIIKLAHSIDVAIVAEGVEDERQLEFLKSIGCEYAQGYYFAKPMCIREFNLNYFK